MILQSKLHLGDSRLSVSPLTRQHQHNQPHLNLFWETLSFSLVHAPSAGGGEAKERHRSQPPGKEKAVRVTNLGAVSLGR